MKLIQIFLKNSIFWIFLLCGLILFFYPAIFINHELMPGDLGDARFVNYLLEHGWLWLNQVELHKSFWDMPMFYQYQNTLAFSDVLLGGMIIYAPIRMLVNNPQTALQVWCVILCILNYLSMYMFMKKVFNFSNLQSSSAAFLFAFGLPRNFQMGHLQLYLQFFMIFSLTAFCSVKKENSKIKNNFLFFIGVMLFVLQVYTSFYLGWFMVFAAFVAGLIFFYSPVLRVKLYDFLKFYYKEILIYGAASIILLIPLALHYMSVGAEFNWRPEFLFKFSSFLMSDSAMDRLIWQNPFKCSLEAHTGIGYITTILVILGIFNCKKYRKFIFLFLGIVVLFFWNSDLNYLLYQIIPGASAIRAGGRCIFLLLIIFSFGLANFLKNVKRNYLVGIFVVLFLLEQIPYKSGLSWTKSEHQKRLANYPMLKSCNVVYFDVLTSNKANYNVDIIWKATEENVYTVNGYSGYEPPIQKDIVKDECKFVIEKEF